MSGFIMVNRGTETLITREKYYCHVPCEKFPFQDAEFENDHAENHVLKIGGFLKKNDCADAIGYYLVFIN